MAGMSVQSASAIAEAELTDELAELERLGLVERVVIDDEERWGPTLVALLHVSEAA
jgi:DNA-binding HxlR family transcriptional regulator